MYPRRYDNHAWNTADIALRKQSVWDAAYGAAYAQLVVQRVQGDIVAIAVEIADAAVEKLQDHSQM